MSADYDPTQAISIDFFKTVQNKLHWAVTGRTAAEIIHDRANAQENSMGLTSWRGTKIRKQEVWMFKKWGGGTSIKVLSY